jgi:hypothetical protein
VDGNKWFPEPGKTIVIFSNRIQLKKIKKICLLQHENTNLIILDLKHAIAGDSKNLFFKKIIVYF